MKIKSIHLQDFKRFTDLTVTGIPETTKLVILIGANGSGKTSLFEAFNFYVWSGKKQGAIDFSEDYHWKSNTLSDHKTYGPLHRSNKVEFHDTAIRPSERAKYPEQIKKMFYIRSPYRHEPLLNVGQISQLGEMVNDITAVSRMIYWERKVVENYQRLIWRTIRETFNEDNKSKTGSEIIDDLLGELRTSMRNVFDDLLLSSLTPPDKAGTFVFDKGDSKDFVYANLSGGEKAAFDLLLDFIVKRDAFDNTVYCIDEPELHMHTKLQSKLLDELYAKLPENCQLWIATHSIGMMRRAMELYQENPNEVVFLDFDEHNFDKPTIMKPAIVNRQFWKKLFSVAMDDLAELVAPSEVVFCEGKPDHDGSDTFDAEIYRTIFSETHPQTEFVPMGSHSEVEKNSLLIENVLQHLFTSVKMWRLFDRDDRSDIEINELAQKGVKVLRYRHIESYLWGDEILKYLCLSVNKENCLPEILSEKHRLLSELSDRDKPSDDIKSISGQLYTFVKKKLELIQCGNNAKSFAKTTLAPLITPNTKVYQVLEEDVFGK